MSDFKTAIALTLRHEGGFVNNSNDPGGATNMGVEQRDLPDVDIKTLTVEQATDYYRQNYWKPLYSQIEDQFVANKIFDLGVLFGIETTVKILQTVLQVVVDGVFGPMTLAEVNASEPVSLLTSFKTALVSHALKIGADNPPEREFVIGWIRRINS